MKKVFAILLLALVLGGCVSEGRTYNPDSMHYLQHDKIYTNR